MLIAVAERTILVLFPQEAVVERERFNLGSHEAPEGVFGFADDRFAARTSVISVKFLGVLLRFSTGLRLRAI